MTTLAADRGGPVDRAARAARAPIRAAARGTALAPRPVESSPIGTRALALSIAALALAGLMAFGGGLYIYAKAAAGQLLMHWAWSRSASTGAPVKPWPWADTRPVARLHVPSQDADAFVLAGASGRTLAWGPGHLDGSAPPGAAGNTVLYAHRDTHFRFLARIVPGDAVALELPDGATRHYRVRDVFVADVRSLRLPRDTSVPTLTLVTCYPFDALAPGGPLRYVVVTEAEGSPRPTL
jgi:sortase A